MKNSNIKNNNILVVDGTNLIFRNYFVHSYSRTKAGIHTGGLNGTIRSLRSYINNFNPRQVLVCFDKSGYTFRNEIYPDYKGTRKKTDEELKNQFPMLKKYCELVNIPFIEMDMYEADDLIGSLCFHAKDYGLNSYAVTGDKDIIQLMTKDINILYLSNKEGPIIYTEEKLREEYKIEAGQFVDYNALVGVPSDNIPGVRGVGKKTAAKLLDLYDTLDGIYENIDDLKGVQRQRIIEDRDRAYLSKKLFEIKLDLDLDYDKYLKTSIEEGFDLYNDSVKDYLKGLEIEIMDKIK